MKRQLACIGLMVAAATLSGCYYDPGYTYVRGSGSAGDAYYGSGSTYYASPYDSYYGPAYYNGYYGYPSGVNIGISTRWYGGSHYRGYRGHDHRYRGHDDRHGHRDGRRRGDHHH